MFFTRTPTLGARTGVLHSNGLEIVTPNFIISTIRGALPHLTPDHPNPPSIAAVYAEDMWDREGIVPECTVRNNLVAKSPLLVAGVRRPQSPFIKNKPNTDQSMAISTTQGSRMASIPDMTKFMTNMHPDILVLPYDIPAQSAPGAAIGSNRVLKMRRRSELWTKTISAEYLNSRRSCSSNNTTTIAVTLPPQLCNADYLAEIDGLYNAYCFNEICSTLPSNADLTKLRLNISGLHDWSQIVNVISRGADLVDIDVTYFSDKGLALTLSLNADSPEYIDLNSNEFVANKDVLGKTGFMLGYIHHLLEAKEMTAQVILQLHNIGVVEELFKQIQGSIAQNTFHDLAEKFKLKYGSY